MIHRHGSSTTYGSSLGSGVSMIVATLTPQLPRLVNDKSSLSQTPEFIEIVELERQ